MENRRIDKTLGFKFNNTYVNLPKIFFSREIPQESIDSRLVKFNKNLAKDLGLDIEELDSDLGAKVFSGEYLIKGSNPISKAYAGHQFGHFTMLGDGRNILLGEHVDKDNRRFDIELKGSGRTKYSRGGDGKATLGPMLREYIISEAMYSLGIPTTRSLAVTLTGEDVYREEALPGAVLTRVASSHIRVGTFQYAANFTKDEDDIKMLANYTIKRHFNYIEDKNKYLGLLKEVIKKQAKLISQWQLVGFVHGVMNTDNTAISGETIDYGPCAFMDNYKSNTVFSSIDRQGRYAYGNQPNIAVWNLARFAETLLTLIDDDMEKAIKKAEEELGLFSEYYLKYWYRGMRNKLGIFDEEEIDKNLIESLLTIMETHKFDYTNTFYDLTTGNISEKMEDNEDFKQWKELWLGRINNQNRSKQEIKELMMKSNPVIIPRNHVVEKALNNAVENNDYTLFNDFLEVLKTPYDYEKDLCSYREVPKDNGPYVTYCGT